MGLKIALAVFPLGFARFPEETLTHKAFSVLMVYIAPWELVYPLLAFPFLASTNTWHLFTSRAISLGSKVIVQPLFRWPRAYIIMPAEAIIGFTDLYLANTILQQRQAMVDQLISKPPSHIVPTYQPTIQFLPQPVANPLPPSSKPPGLVEQCVDELRSLLRLCNMATEEDLPGI